MKTIMLVLLLLSPDMGKYTDAVQGYKTMEACQKDAAAIRRVLDQKNDPYVLFCAPIEGGVRS